MPCHCLPLSIPTSLVASLLFFGHARHASVSVPHTCWSLCLNVLGILFQFIQVSIQISFQRELLWPTPPLPSPMPLHPLTLICCFINSYDYWYIVSVLCPLFPNRMQGQRFHVSYSLLYPWCLESWDHSCSTNVIWRKIWVDKWREKYANALSEGHSVCELCEHWTVLAMTGNFCKHGLWSLGFFSENAIQGCWNYIFKMYKQ